MIKTPKTGKSGGGKKDDAAAPVERDSERKLKGVYALPYTFRVSSYLAE